MTIGIEPQATPEARRPREVLFGHASDIVEKPMVRFIQLRQHVGERKVPLLFRHLRIEGIDPAVLDVSWWPTSLDDERQVLQRLLLPRGHVRKDIFHRPGVDGARLHEL
jgi:hypothetical protein